MPRDRRTSWGVGIALIAGALVLAWLLWPRARSAHAPAAATEESAAAAASSAGGSFGQLPPGATLARPDSPGAAAEEPPPPGATPEAPAAAPPEEFPPGTQPLAEEFYPGTTDWNEAPLDGTKEYVLRILPVRYNVVVPMPIAVRMELLDRQGRRQPLKNPEVRVKPLDRPEAPWIDVPVKDDGAGADRQAGDREYTATLQPDASQRKGLLGRVLVEGSVDVPAGGRRFIPATLIYTLGPRARLTGRWNDYAKDGHLYLEAELEVEEAGLFTLMAQIFGPGLEPIAWVKETRPLRAGRGSLTLEVFGKALHDAAVDGPYRVRQVLLSRDYENSSDYDPGVTIEEAHRTKAYRAQDFSAAAYTPPPRQVAEEVTAEHPSQKNKPPPERTRTP